MQIITKNYKWAKPLKYRNVKEVVDDIVLHHSASGNNLTPEQIHAEHIKKGWAGIGYHFVIAHDGKVYTGRPITAVGSNVENQNAHIIGICFVGNFEINGNVPTAAQIKSGIELINYLNKIKKFNVKGHKDYKATACPGKNFPLEKFKKI